MSAALLQELRELEARANALSELGVEVEKRPVWEDRAKLDYKELKEHLATRAKEFDRRPPEDAEDWAVATFSGALRKAHIAMRAPTNTSPRNHTWRNSVHEVCFELSYYAATFAKGMER